VAKLVPGRAQYCIIPTETGGAVDDAYLYMYEEDKYLLIVNASNTDKDLRHFAKYLPDFDCTITNITDTYSSIAVQGPDAEKILKVLTGGKEITGPKKNDLGEVDMEGHTVRASKTGYTGDPIGWELFIDAKDVNWLWNRLIELGAAPTALGARDTLRLEASLPLYGHEMGEDHAGDEMPIFAVSLAKFAVSFAEEKGDYIARDILKAQKENGTPKLVGSVAQDSIEMGYQAVLQCIAAVEGGTAKDVAIAGQWYNAENLISMLDSNLIYTDAPEDAEALRK
jgi:aminomethyltransferase